MLTIQKLHDVKKLQKECETQGNFQLKLNWDMLENRDTTQLDFFQYEKGELVAFLALYPFGSTVEVCGMVKPNERQKGLFSSLFKKGLEIALQNGYKEILLNAPSESHSAKFFLNKQGAIYKFTEHQMEWQDRIPEPVEDLTLRKATVEDLDISTRLSIEAFGMSKEDALSAETDDMLMIEINEKNNFKIGRMYKVSKLETPQSFYFEHFATLTLHSMHNKNIFIFRCNPYFAIIKNKAMLLIFMIPELNFTNKDTTVNAQANGKICLPY